MAKVSINSQIIADQLDVPVDSPHISGCYNQIFKIARNIKSDKVAELLIEKYLREVKERIHASNTMD